MNAGQSYLCRIRRLKWTLFGLAALFLTAVEAYYCFVRGVSLIECLVDGAIGLVGAGALVAFGFRAVARTQGRLQQEIAERSRAEKALERERTAFRIVAEAAVAAAGVPDLCRRILAGLIEVLGFDFGTVRLYDEAGQVLRLAAAVGLNGEEAKLPPQPIDDPRHVAALVARTRQAIFAPDVSGHRILQTHEARLDELGIRSLISWPILGTEQALLGVIHLISRTPRTIPEADRRFFQTVVGTFATALDRTQAEEALRESEERYRSLFERVPVGLYRTTPAGEILDANPALVGMLGYPDREALLAANAAGLFVDPEDRRRELDVLEGKGVVYDYEMQLCRRDGVAIWVRDTTRAMCNVDGQVLYYEGSLEDITRRRRAEEERRELEGKLERARRMEALGVLAGGVAHDLNNLLGPMVAYPDLILESLPSDSPVRDDVLQIRKEAERAAAVVQDLLTLARRGAYQMAPLNLNAVVQDYVRSSSFAAVAARHPDVVASVDLDPGLLNLLGSPPHLCKTVMNLVTNAFEAMPGEGRLTIRTSCESLDRPVAGYEHIEAGDYVVLRVGDTGSGIGEKELDRLFEPFYSKKEMGRSGSGLGLAVVHGVVHDHKGRIDLRTGAGRGTEFTLYFPVTREVPWEAAEDGDDCRGSETILVVDDLEEQRELASRLLSSLGYRVYAVESGRAAAEYLKGKEADILVLDMIMEKGSDGLDAYREIVQIRPGQKAIIASGFSETGRVKEAQRLGAGPFVKKPYTLNCLGRAVRRELDRTVRSPGELPGSLVSEAS